MRLTEATSTVKPFKLKRGDTIGITASSSQINVKNVSTFVNKLEEYGFNVILGATITHVNDEDYNSTNARERAKDFNRMVEDENIQAIWAAAGGFGAQSVTPYLNFGAIQANKKPIIGFSDTTFLLNTITDRTGLTTFLGPTAEYASEKDIPSFKYALSCLAGSHEYPYLVENLDGTIIRRVADNDDIKMGRLMGGNLTMIQTTLGTPYQPDFNGKILLLEEVGESSYSIERTIDHLKSAGVFDNLNGIVFGEFSRVAREPVEDAQDSNPSINEILYKHFKNAPYPVLLGYNFSHGTSNLTLPIGGIAKINGENRTLEILETPLK